MWTPKTTKKAAWLTQQVPQQRQLRGQRVWLRRQQPLLARGPVRAERVAPAALGGGARAEVCAGRRRRRGARGGGGGLALRREEAPQLAGGRGRALEAVGSAGCGSAGRSWGSAGSNEMQREPAVLTWVPMGSMLRCECSRAAQRPPACPRSRCPRLKMYINAPLLRRAALRRLKGLANSARACAEGSGSVPAAADMITTPARPASHLIFHGGACAGDVPPGASADVGPDRVLLWFAVPEGFTAATRRFTDAQSMSRYRRTPRLAWIGAPRLNLCARKSN
jgi:hypothetical protein